MAKFLNRFQVTDELKKIIENAHDYLFLISPYFKLNEKIKTALAKHRTDKKFQIIVVYGKNEDSKQKSLSDADLEFFKSFPNVEIRYHKKLHAKIYVNERYCLATSMNLHDYSMNENIEFGILTESKALDALTSVTKSLNIDIFPNSLDQEAFNFCEYIIEKSEVEFKKDVQKESSFFGLFTKLGKATIEVEKQRYGYCIRTGTKIAFDFSHPYSSEAYQSWNRYKNPDYLEKFCHECGKQAKTSFKKPQCFDCWGKNQ